MSNFLRPLPNKSQVAQKYAKAFIETFLLADSVKVIERFLNIYQFCKNKQTFFVRLALEKKNLIDQKKQLAELQALLNLDENDLTFLNLLAQRGKIFHLPEICKHVILIAARRFSVEVFLVSTSSVLNQQEKDVVFKFLYKSTTKKPLIIFTVDNLLISGIRIESDCFLYEKSIKSRFDKTLLTLRSIAE